METDKVVMLSGVIVFFASVIIFAPILAGTIMRGIIPANGAIPIETQFTLYLGREYTAPGEGSGYEYFYSGLGNERQPFAIISRVDNSGYSGSGIEIRVRLNATVYLGARPYTLIQITNDFIVLELIK